MATVAVDVREYKELYAAMLRCLTPALGYEAAELMEEEIYPSLPYPNAICDECGFVLKEGHDFLEDKEPKCPRCGSDAPLCPENQQPFIQLIDPPDKQKD